MSRFRTIAIHRSLARAIAVAMALSIAGPVLAQDASPAAQPATPKAAKPASTEREAQLGSQIKKPVDMDKVVVFPGAVHGSHDAQWTDGDTSAPQLPMVHEKAQGTR